MLLMMIENGVLVISWVGLGLLLLVFMFIRHLVIKRVKAKEIKSKRALLSEVLIDKDYEWATEIIDWFVACDYLPKKQSDDILMQITSYKEMQASKKKMFTMYRYNDWNIPDERSIEDELL